MLLSLNMEQDSLPAYHLVSACKTPLPATSQQDTQIIWYQLANFEYLVYIMCTRLAVGVEVEEEVGHRSSIYG